ACAAGPRGSRQVDARAVCSGAAGRVAAALKNGNSTTMQIPLVDLKSQYASIRHEVEAAMRPVLEEGCFILGPPVDAFERSFAAFCGAKHCVGVANGTDALQLIFRGLGIGPGDEVIVPAFTFIAS